MLVKVIVATAIVGILALLVVIEPRTANDQKPTRAAYEIENYPLTIAISNIRRELWHVSINSAGEGELTVILDVSAQRRRLEFTAAKEQVGALRKLLLSQRLFDLADAYGDHVPDSGTTTLTVIAGDELKTVRIHYLNNLISDDKRKLRELARALRVLELIYGWCDDPITVRARRSLQDVIKRAEG